MNPFAIRIDGKRVFIMGNPVAKPKPVATPPSELDRAKKLGLVGAVKTGPRDVAARHSEYLKAKLRSGAARSR